MPLIAATLSCTGAVQGVGFRMLVVKMARQLGLTGWVRNEDDSTVAIFAVGRREQIEKLAGLLRGVNSTMGPKVSAVEITGGKEMEKSPFPTFDIGQ